MRTHPLHWATLAPTPTLDGNWKRHTGYSCPGKRSRLSSPLRFRHKSPYGTNRRKDKTVRRTVGQGKTR